MRAVEQAKLNGPAFPRLRANGRKHPSDKEFRRMSLKKIEPKVLERILSEQKRGRPLEDIADVLERLKISPPQDKKKIWTAAMVAEVLQSEEILYFRRAPDGDL